jgi:hypothetical protein
MDKYKIFAIYYSKPIIRPNSNGEIIFGSIGVTLEVGQTDNFGLNLKKIESIEYDEDMRAFRVNFPKGGLKIIPLQGDTEVTYELIK